MFRLQTEHSDSFLSCIEIFCLSWMIRYVVIYENRCYYTWEALKKEKQSPLNGSKVSKFYAKIGGRISDIPKELPLKR